MRVAVPVFERVLVCVAVTVPELLTVKAERVGVGNAVDAGESVRERVPLPLPVRVAEDVGDTNVHGQKRKDWPSDRAAHVATPPPNKHCPDSGSYSGFCKIVRLPGARTQ